MKKLQTYDNNKCGTDIEYLHTRPDITLKNKRSLAIILFLSMAYVLKVSGLEIGNNFDGYVESKRYAKFIQVTNVVIV